MAQDDVSISIGATDDTGDAVDAVAASLTNLARTTGRASREARGLDRDTTKVARSSRLAAGGLSDLEQVAQGVGGRVGELAGRARNLGAGLGALGPVGGVAAASLVAVGAGALATFKTFELGVQISASLFRSFEEARAAGVTFGADVSERVDDAAASLRAAQVAGGGLVADAVAYWQPAIHEFSVTTAAGAIQVRKAFEAMGLGSSTLRQNLVSLVQLGFAPLLDMQRMVAEGALTVSRALGVDLPSDVQAALNSFGTFDQVLAGMAVDSLGDLRESFGDSFNEAENLVGAIRRMESQAPATTAGVEEMTKAALEFDKAAALAAQSLQALKDGGKDGLPFDKQAALTAQALQAQKAALDGGQAAATDYTLALDSLGQSFANTAQLAKSGTLAAFRAQQAAAIAGIAVDAVRNAVALAAPPPVGLGPIAGPLFAVAQGATAATAVAAQPPPSFDIGGVVTGGPAPRGGQAGQVMAQVQVGERILTRRDMADLAALAGGGGGTTVVELRVGNRTTDRMLVENERGGGRASQYTRSRGVHQRRYRGQA